MIDCPWGMEPLTRKGRRETPEVMLVSILIKI